MAKIDPVAIVPSEILSFLNSFPGEHIFVAIKENENSDEDSKVYHFPGTIRKHYKELKRLNGRGFDIYFTVNESTNGRRRIQDITRCRAVFIDDDIPRDKYRSDFILKPSIIVETSPNKFHYYWLTSTENTEEWVNVEEGIVLSNHGDPQVKDLPRIMRLPGFVHTKSEYTTSVIKVTGQYYEWNKIKSVYPPLTKTKDTTEIEKSSSTFDFGKAVHDFLTGEHITLPMNSLIMHYAMLGCSKKTIRKHIDSLFTTIPQDVYEQHSQRYRRAEKQIDKFIKTAKKKADNPLELPQVDPIPLDQYQSDYPELEIPENAVPSILLEAAKAQAKSNATHKDPAILAGLVIASSLLGKNVNIHATSTLKTNCQIGILMAAESGGRKTSMYEQMNKPFFDYEKALRESWKEEQHKRSAEVKLLKGLYDSQHKKLITSSASVSEITSASEKLAEIGERISSLDIPQPRLHTADTTQEKLILSLERNQGAMAVISDDARPVIDNMLGRYVDGGTAESIYITGLTNNNYVYDRKGDDTEIMIEKVCLNTLLFVQPDKAMKLLESDMYIESGLAARMPIYFYQFDGADIVENSQYYSVGDDKMDEYFIAIQNLQSQRYRRHPPIDVKLSTNAIGNWKKFNNKIAKRLRNEWVDQYSLVNKISTQSVIYATIFAALEDRSLGTMIKDEHVQSTYTLSTKYLLMGQRFAEALFDHCIEAHKKIHNDEVIKISKNILKTIRNKYHAEKQTRADRLALGKPLNAALILDGFSNNPTFRRILPSHKLRANPGLVEDALHILTDTGWLLRTFTDKLDKRRGAGLENLGYEYHYNEAGVQRVKEKGRVRILEKD